jgi:SPP1 family predicted phage head-tail adaptor
MYRPGELDQLITVQRETLTDDGMGGQEIALTNVATDIWAKARPLSGKEYDRHDKLNASAMYLFVIRARDDLNESDRIIWNGNTYNIRSILPRGSRSLYLEIDAERGVAP